MHIAFDADDTLWHNEPIFILTQDKVAELLAEWVPAGELGEKISQMERRNLELFGYGAKGFTLSLVETDGYLGLTTEFGPWFTVFAVYSYAILFTATVMLGYALSESSRYRKAMVAMVILLMTVAACVVASGGWAARALVHAGALPADIEPEDLKFLGQLSNLRKLRISPKRRDRNGPGFEQCQGLEELMLLNSPDKNILAEVARIRGLQKLTILDLAYFFKEDKEKQRVEGSVA